MNTRLDARTYSFHGLGLHVSADPLIARAVHARFAQLPQIRTAASDLCFQFICVQETEKQHLDRPTEAARPIYESAAGDVLFADDTDVLSITCPDTARVICAPSDGRTRVSILHSQAERHQWLISHPLLTLPLIETLKRRGLYSVHAAGLAANGNGLILAGTSGAGKSTLTLALLRGGFDFLGDDMLFLKRKGDGLRLLAFPDEIDITDETASFFPELSDLRETPKDQGWPKHQISPTTHFAAKTVWACHPAAVVFPRVAGTGRSVLAPIDRDEALMELAPNVLLTTTAESQAHLNALAELVETSRCYRLETGRDLENIPALLGGLIR